jgi:hypothetical protein
MIKTSLPFRSLAILTLLTSIALVAGCGPDTVTKTTTTDRTTTAAPPPSSTSTTTTTEQSHP